LVIWRAEAGEDALKRPTDPIMEHVSISMAILSGTLEGGARGMHTAASTIGDEA
jgi:hypothetical protein